MIKMSFLCNYSLVFITFAVKLIGRVYARGYQLHSGDEASFRKMPGENDLELAHVYNQNKVGLKNFERIKEEYASLGISGRSRTLNDSVKIVWFNQTRILRIFTPINDETLITKYAETIIRRTFGTPDAMRLAKPVTQDIEKMSAPAN